LAGTLPWVTTRKNIAEKHTKTAKNAEETPKNDRKTTENDRKLTENGRKKAELHIWNNVKMTQNVGEKNKKQYKTIKEQTPIKRFKSRNNKQRKIKHVSGKKKVRNPA
jgi:hypothetical protein